MKSKFNTEFSPPATFLLTTDRDSMSYVLPHTLPLFTSKHHTFLSSISICSLTLTEFKQYHKKQQMKGFWIILYSYWKFARIKRYFKKCAVVKVKVLGFKKEKKVFILLPWRPWHIEFELWTFSWRCTVFSHSTKICPWSVLQNFSHRKSCLFISTEPLNGSPSSHPPMQTHSLTVQIGHFDGK